MMSLSGIPIAAARLAPPEHKLCRPNCCGSKEVALNCLQTRSRALEYDNFSFLNFMPFLVWETLRKRKELLE